MVCLSKGPGSRASACNHSGLMRQGAERENLAPLPAVVLWVLVLGLADPKQFSMSRDYGRTFCLCYRVCFYKSDSSCAEIRGGVIATVSGSG